VLNAVLSERTINKLIIRTIYPIMNVAKNAPNFILLRLITFRLIGQLQTVMMKDNIYLLLD
jgi:hypothetical protein